MVAPPGPLSLVLSGGWWGGLVFWVFCFFRMRFVVARRAQTNEIIINKRKRRKLVGMFDMMNDNGFTVFAVPLTPLALISVAPLDILGFSFPPSTFIIKFHIAK